jgi:hypothetical protein
MPSNQGIGWGRLARFGCSLRAFWASRSALVNCVNYVAVEGSYPFERGSTVSYILAEVFVVKLNTGAEYNDQSC